MPVVQVYPSNQFPAVSRLPVGSAIDLLRRIQAANVAVTTVAGLNTITITADIPLTSKNVLQDVKAQLQSGASGTGLTKEACVDLLQEVKDFLQAQKP